MTVTHPTNRWVIKLGTSVLTAGTAQISPRRLLEIVRQVAHLHEQSMEIVLVTSGAMAAGREQLDNPDLGRNIPAKQMLSAVGQPRLMHLYADLFALFDIDVAQILPFFGMVGMCIQVAGFALFGIDVAQILLTRSDFSHRLSYLNARDSLNALLAHHVIPIVNENDAIATEEIKLGDNDNLSALVANLVDADRLILLTDQPGLFTTDPRSDPDAQLISTVDEINDDLFNIAGGAGTSLGTGGMTTKLQAAQLATRSGTTVVIAQGARPDVLLELAGPDARSLGTWFQPSSSHVESRKRWILSERTPGSLTVDEGAARILRGGGASLLPVGVTAIAGAFERGVVVRVLDPAGQEIARGLSNYSARSLERILGCQSDEIEARLGYTYGDEVIHRDHLVLV